MDVDKALCVAETGAVPEQEEAISVLAGEVRRLREEVAVDDKLLAEHRWLLDMFERPAHGSRCIPHAVAEVKRLREVEAGVAARVRESWEAGWAAGRTAALHKALACGYPNTADAIRVLPVPEPPARESEVKRG